mgnify:CR=1 FL=1
MYNRFVKAITPSATIVAVLLLSACGGNSRRAEIEQRRAALIHKQDSALAEAQQQLAFYDQQLQQAEATYDSLTAVVEQHRNNLIATEQELRSLNLLRQHRDSLRVTCQTLGAKIRYIHLRQKENQ